MALTVLKDPSRTYKTSGSLELVEFSFVAWSIDTQKREILSLSFHPWLFNNFHMFQFWTATKLQNMTLNTETYVAFTQNQKCNILSLYTSVLFQQYPYIPILISLKPPATYPVNCLLMICYRIQNTPTCWKGVSLHISS